MTTFTKFAKGLLHGGFIQTRVLVAATSACFASNHKKLR